MKNLIFPLIINLLIRLTKPGDRNAFAIVYGPNVFVQGGLIEMMKIMLGVLEAMRQQGVDVHDVKAELYKLKTSDQEPILEESPVMRRV